MEHQIRDPKTQYFVRLVENPLGECIVIVMCLTHTRVLRALPREYIGMNHMGKL